MDYENQYQLWCGQFADQPELLKELQGFTEAEKKDAFYCDLAFGTGGLRGVLGLGTNRMNIYTVRKATQGLANHLNRTCKHAPSVAISYDSRRCSDIFAKETACVLAANGIKAWIYPRLQPTPALSFAVRDLSCDAGICITASHNPAEYNGYKVYGADGCQITLEAAALILEQIQGIDIFHDVKICAESDGRSRQMILDIPEATLDRFIESVEALSVQPSPLDASEISAVYTPLNGTGLECVRRIAESMGIRSLHVVPEQEKPDGNFPTCPYPNPEIPEALSLGIQLSRKLNADLLIGTDPDCDRVGVAVPHEGEYCLLTGNEVGILLFDYICKMRSSLGTMPENPVAITTIVSTDMADAIARKYGVELRRTLTGFKFIGEQIGILEKNGEKERYIFGFEESCGYLSGTHARDKDGVNGVMLILEMLVYYKHQGKDLWQVMQGLYEEYGFVQNDLISVSFPGAEGNQKRIALMNSLRSQKNDTFAGCSVQNKVDYLQDETGLPKADVITFSLAQKCKAIVRPSGTEPKIKVYISAWGTSHQEAAAKLQALKTAINTLFIGDKN